MRFLYMLIKNTANLQTGLFAKPSRNGDWIYLQSRYFDEDGQLNTPLHPDLISEGFSEKHLLQTGDVLFTAKGMKNVAIVFKGFNFPTVASTSFFILRSGNDALLPEYLAWFLNHPETQKILKEKAKGTSIPSIRKSDLENIEIIIPDINKQKLIVKINDRAKTENKLRNQISVLKNKLIEQKLFNSIK